MTGYAWWQPLMLASCKWLWQWVPSHQARCHEEEESTRGGKHQCSISLMH